MSIKSFLGKTRTLISGDFREIERNCLAAKNARVIKRYQGKEEIYCVLRLYTDEGGLFNFFLKALAGISYSIQYGYIPVIDMQTNHNIFCTAQERKNTNAWEYFFEQPSGVGFNEIKGKKNLIVLENPRMPGGSLLSLTRLEKPVL